MNPIEKAGSSTEVLEPALGLRYFFGSTTGVNNRS